MAELTYLVPSRGRPKNAVQLYESFRETCTADTKLIILVDSDDPTLSTYYTLLNGVGQVVVVNPEKRGMVEALQQGYEMLQDNLGFAVGFMGDDHRPRTVGWDTRYLDALHNLGTGFVYSDDLYQGETMATQVAMTSDIPAALGYMCPPGFDHLCVDVVWTDLGRELDKIVYLDDVVVEHMHYLAGKSKMDKGYAAVNNIEMANHDNGYYSVYKSDGTFDADVAKLKKLLVKPASANDGLMKSVEDTFKAYDSPKKRGRPAKKTEVPEGDNEVGRDA